VPCYRLYMFLDMARDLHVSWDAGCPAVRLRKCAVSSSGVPIFAAA
jgi:hypothetical protein